MKKIFTLLILLIVVIVGAILLSQTSSEELDVDLEVNKRVVVEIDGSGNSYSPEEFSAYVESLDGSRPLMFVDSALLGTTEPYYVVFHTIADLEDFAERNGLEESLLK